QTGHLLGIHTPITSLVLKIADYLPFFSRVPGWFSNHMKVHMMRKDIGPYAAFALKLRSREGPSAAKSLQAASRAASSEQPPQGAHPEAVPAHPRH
ncbi:MAG TPA: hypothetical protein VI874_02645, partial [Candidatus Norongarragalinales archaeon]|nr:hypothetical protein [Candidatus Norongarragalinales archaeon]